MNRVLQLQQAQDRAINIMEGVPQGGGVDVVINICTSLRRLMDAEIRHVTLSSTGLERTLARVFVECVSALQTEDGASVNKTCAWLRDEVFAPRNERYGDSFIDFGAVGVVIRLLDHARALETAGDEQREMSLAHIANYATMTMMVIEGDR
jgi:hypothetical protein